MTSEWIGREARVENAVINRFSVKEFGTSWRHGSEKRLRAVGHSRANGGGMILILLVMKREEVQTVPKF